jgi:gluconate 2-dehydrogenase gamma chain
MDRREFLIVTVGGTATGLLLVSCSGRAGPWTFFTPAEADLVEALADQIIPPDRDPGGKWAGVARFIDRQLSTHYRGFRERYRIGLAALEETSRALRGRNFEGLSDPERIELLEIVERNEAPEGIWELESASSFFELLRDHCMQGFYGNPRHGGNRDYISYRMIGLDYPQILGRVK